MIRFVLILFVTVCLSLQLKAGNPTHIELNHISSYHTGIFDESAAEIPAYDPITKRLFVVKANNALIDIFDISDVSIIQKINSIDLSFLGKGVNSVAVHNGILAIAVENNKKTQNGITAFFNTEGEYLSHYEVGALPDMLTFTPDGNYVIVCNEGEPNSDYSKDPEGTVSIIDIRNGVMNALVNTADFKSYDGMEDELRKQGIRIFGPNAVASTDFEPEYAAVYDNSQFAAITLQENNAIAIIHIPSATVTQLIPLGLKDHSITGNGLDASDRDGIINITEWPVKGMYLPDAIATYSVNGTRYFVTANEGDAREYDTFEEEARIKSLVLNTESFPNASYLQKDENIGRLNVTTVNGDHDGDGIYEELYVFGARSFSIWDQSGNQIWDSGDEFEKITSEIYPNKFNASNSDNDFDSRSDNKGPEPEGLFVTNYRGEWYAFIGLERIGGIMIYNINNPEEPYFVNYTNNRDFNALFSDSPSKEELIQIGDLGIEGLIRIPANESPNGQDLIVTANETSGSISIFSLISNPELNVKNLITCKGSEVMLGNYDFENNISNTVLYGSGDYDIQWEPSILLDNSNSPNPIFIQPFASQNFSVKVTDNVSGITISDIVNVKVKETPSISMPILMNHPKNTPLDLTQLISNINGGTAPYSVQWSQLVNGEYININNPTDIIPATGINKFFATALDSNACTSKPKQLVVYVSPRKDGIDSEIIKSVNGTIVFAAYPIPAVSELNTLIELTESKPAILRIIDTEGSEIISNTIIPGNTENTISISELASGVYFIQIETDDDFAIMKFIKQ